MVCESIECKNKESEEQNEGINTKLFLDLLLVEAKENFVWILKAHAFILYTSIVVYSSTMNVLHFFLYIYIWVEGCDMHIGWAWDIKLKHGIH